MTVLGPIPQPQFSLRPPLFMVQESPARIVQPPSTGRFAQLPSTVPENTPQRIPTCTSLEMALEYWNHGCSLRGLVVPLSKWEELYDLKSLPPSERMKYTNIKSVVDEIQEEHAGNVAAFSKHYGNLVDCWKKLYEAVRQHKQASGRAKTRKRGCNTK